MARVRFSTQVEQEVADRVRRTVVGMQGSGQPLMTLATFVEAALSRACDEAVAANGGEEFTAPAGPLRTRSLGAPASDEP